MRKISTFISLACLSAAIMNAPALAQSTPPPRPTTAPQMAHPNAPILLETLSWDEAEKILTPDTVIVIALGAESKEHGRHLQLNNDFLMAEYFKKRVLAAGQANVVVAPTINYSFYPAFLEYPGSTSLSVDTARAMLSDIVRSLAHYGPRRFYILNTGISTLGPLAQAAEGLAKDGILLRYTDFTKEDPVEKKLRQSGGTHADEIETSMMLYIAPESVRMRKAARDLNPNQPGGLTRDPHGRGTYSPTGAWGDPTLATREKGEAIVESNMATILKDIADLANARTPPAPRAAITPSSSELGQKWPGNGVKGGKGRSRSTQEGELRRAPARATPHSGVPAEYLRVPDMGSRPRLLRLCDPRQSGQQSCLL